MLVRYFSLMNTPNSYGQYNEAIKIIKRHVNYKRCSRVCSDIVNVRIFNY